MSRPRIIGGTARGYHLKVVPGDTTRPVTDRVKESLFNIIGADIDGSSWLDLFAGTGSIGIEALSRGAFFVQFVDKEPKAITTIKTNLQLTHLSERAKVYRRDAFDLISGVSDYLFDYIYIAPPQYHSYWQKALHILDANHNWTTPDGWIIVQIHPIEYSSQQLTHYKIFDTRRYGSTMLVFYR